jgi:Protein of unknown function (DUF1015)
MKVYDDLGILVPEVLLPKTGVDPHNWAVIAVDQFTSEPEYWDQVEDIVGDDPSTLRITLPEIYLARPEEAERIHDIRNTMRQYLRAGILKSREGLIFVERTLHGKTRRGLMLCLDLERYDFRKSSASLIRATEETIVDRLPPRMKIREGAALELPHILVLIDDPQRTVIEPLIAVKNKLERLYDFALMLESGHLAGWAVTDETPVIAALRNLARPDVFATKYGVGADNPVLLFAIGDGNHSLAAAKAVWEKIKSDVGMNHPTRYALVEIVNIHGDGLEFDPIHRVLFGMKKDFGMELQKHFGPTLKYAPVASAQEMIHAVKKQDGSIQRFGIVGGGHPFGVAEISNGRFHLPVATIQEFLDPFIKTGGAERIDYVHGEDVVVRIGSKPGHLGIYLPGMDKSDLFKTVILDGALPRKTFSMGGAKEKRFYMEARRIS